MEEDIKKTRISKKDKHRRNGRSKVVGQKNRKRTGCPLLPFPFPLAPAPFSLLCCLFIFPSSSIFFIVCIVFQCFHFLLFYPISLYYVCIPLNFKSTRIQKETIVKTMVYDNKYLLSLIYKRWIKINGSGKTDMSLLEGESYGTTTKNILP